MPRSRYRSLYLDTAPGCAPSQEKKRRSGRQVEAGLDRFREVGVCGDESESKREEDESAEEASLGGKGGEEG